MNKIINTIKHLLLIIVILLLIIFKIKYQYFDSKLLLLYICIFIIFVVDIIDIKRKVKLSNKYNILFIMIMIITIFILCRSIFDINFISNSKYYLNIIELYKGSSLLDLEYNDISGKYLSNNFYYLFVLYICIFIYHSLDINKKDTNSKYSNSSIICLIINIIFTIETIKLFSESFNINHFPLLFFTANIVLLVVEITSLIRNNKIKKDYPIYICFLFNMFALIAIFT